jgi:hypothetical protein
MNRFTDSSSNHEAGSNVLAAAPRSVYTKASLEMDKRKGLTV